MALRRTAIARRLVGIGSALGALGLVLMASEARAQQGFALSRLNPAPAGDRMFGVPSAYTAGDPSVREIPLHVMTLVDYAHDPLVLRGASTGQNLGAIVSDQVMVHLNASLSLFHRLTLNVDFVDAFTAGGGATGAGKRFGTPPALTLGDIRLGARVTLYGGYFDPFQLAVGAMVWLPTGSRSGYASDGKVRAEPQLIAGGYLDRRFLWAAALGPELRAATPFADIQPGVRITWGGALGVLVDEDRVLQLGPQLTGSVDVNDTQARTTNIEALFAGRRRFSGDFEAGAGMGIGLAPGAGTPSFRAVAMLAYTPEALPFVSTPAATPRDRDHDGVPDAHDACPDSEGPKSDDPRKNGCPAPRDRDGDAILDGADACPDEVGVKSDDPRKNGCPAPRDRDGDGFPDDKDACPDESGIRSDDPRKNGCLPLLDADGDGISDRADACPHLAGRVTEDPATNGCPIDRDGDGINDDKDACPAEKGLPSTIADKNGCPTDVRVTGSAIVLLQQVQFDSSTAVIRPASKGLLDQLAQVLLEHPEILRVEVQGHTDNQGKKPVNLLLSQRRAEAVVKALIKRNVEETRLLARGYGPDRPIAANLTTEGRARNRRVELVILEKRGGQARP